MKKTSLILLFALYFTSSVTAQENEGINFRAITFDQAIQQAKAEKKPIFLHAFASWCHFCEFMVDSVYKDQEVRRIITKTISALKWIWKKKEGNSIKKLKLKTIPHMFSSTITIQ
ncbi:MAG: DUF255 domain-containing protein [Bacteroidetes bacterium]|nr:DUF255 domain-containing protein [Bacteroidota bacterium]